jgi:predicted MFS family arabinose efflux permease
VLAEITPAKNRGRYMAILNLSVLLGLVFGVGMGVIILDNDVDDYK